MMMRVECSSSVTAGAGGSSGQALVSMVMKIRYFFGTGPSQGVTLFQLLAGRLLIILDGLKVTRQ